MLGLCRNCRNYYLRPGERCFNCGAESAGKNETQASFGNRLLDVLSRNRDLIFGGAFLVNLGAFVALLTMRTGDARDLLRHGLAAFDLAALLYWFVGPKPQTEIASRKETSETIPQISNCLLKWQQKIRERTDKIKQEEELLGMLGSRYGAIGLPVSSTAEFQIRLSERKTLGWCLQLIGANLWFNELEYLREQLLKNPLSVRPARLSELMASGRKFIDRAGDQMMEIFIEDNLSVIAGWRESVIAARRRQEKRKSHALVRFPIGETYALEIGNTEESSVSPDEYFKSLVYSPLVNYREVQSSLNNILTDNESWIS